MKDLILRFPHLAKQIFQQLDNKSLAKCREIERLWQKFIDERNYPWLRIVNIPTILQDGNTYMHLAAQCGQTDMFEVILDEEKNKDPINDEGETAFFVACGKGHLNIISVILKKSDELKIDLNNKHNHFQTPFLVACRKGQMNIASILMKKADELKIHLNSKDNDGRTAFHVACLNGHSEIAEMIMKNSSDLKINLNSKDNGGWTAFHLACRNGHSDIVEMIM
jgi:ankyrin